MLKNIFFAAILVLVFAGIWARFVSLSVQTLFRQPRVSADFVDSRVLAGKLPPPGHFAVILWQMGNDANQSRVSWDMARYTGFRPTGDVSLYQRGPNNQKNTTAVQIQDETVGIWLNSVSVASVGEVLPIVAQYDWPSDTVIHPWQDRTNVLSLSFEIQIPCAERSGEGQAYVTAPFIFHDTSLNRAFWYNLQIFDLRDSLQEQIIYDVCAECAGQPIVVSRFTKKTNFGHIAANSALFSSLPWSGFRYFEYRITALEFARAVAALQANTRQRWSSQLSHYRLTHVNINPEIYAPRERGEGKIGLSARNIKVALK